jgi:hypothetical protein
MGAIKHRRTWWERGGWLCDQVDYVPSDELVPDAELARRALELLVVILHDRNTLKVEAQRRSRSNKLKRLGLDKQQPADLQEITLYCPRHFSTADGEGTHARPRMHYRAEHTRQQAHGPRSSLRKEIVIAAQWINAADVHPVELNPGAHA